MAWTERYIRADAAGGGDGTTDTNSGANGAFTLAEAITHSTTNTGIRYNWKAGTYTNTTTTRTFSGNGTTIAPNWWRGFKTTLGDMDGTSTSHGTFGAATEIPYVTFTTGQFTVSGTHQIFSNLDITAARNGTTLNNSSGTTVFQLDRVRVENTSANSASGAYSMNGPCVATRCWFKATSTATSVVTAGASNNLFDGCVIRGGGDGIAHSNGSLFVIFCSIDDVGGSGITTNNTASNVVIINCTIRSPGNDGVRFTGTMTGGTTLVANNLLVECAYGIQNNIGVNTNFVKRLGNVFYNNASGRENGLGDTPSLAQLDEVADPFTNAAGSDLSLKSTALSKAGGQPGPFENETYIGYLDAGAVQRQESGSSSLLVSGGMTGGMHQS